MKTVHQYVVYLRDEKESFLLLERLYEEGFAFSGYVNKGISVLALESGKTVKKICFEISFFGNQDHVQKILKFVESFSKKGFLGMSSYKIDSLTDFLVHEVEKLEVSLHGR